MMLEARHNVFAHSRCAPRILPLDFLYATCWTIGKISRSNTMPCLYFGGQAGEKSIRYHLIDFSLFPVSLERMLNVN